MQVRHEHVRVERRFGKENLWTRKAGGRCVVQLVSSTLLDKGVKPSRRRIGERGLRKLGNGMHIEAAAPTNSRSHPPWSAPAPTPSSNASATDRTLALARSRASRGPSCHLQQIVPSLRAKRSEAVGGGCELEESQLRIESRARSVSARKGRHARLLYRTLPSA